MIRVGLTGGIAAGKSTVAEHLRELGATVIDYDQLARDVVRPGSIGLQRIKEVFGSDAISEDGTLNRTWMAEHVFSVSAPQGARERLDAIEHPLIYELAGMRERQAATKQSGVIVHDVPLLAEVIDTIPFRFDRIITVEAPEAIRIQRMIETRNMTKEQALARIRHQSTQNERQSIADIIIDSTQPKHLMLRQVEELYNDLTL